MVVYPPLPHKGPGACSNGGARLVVGVTRSHILVDTFFLSLSYVCVDTLEVSVASTADDGQVS